MYRPIVLVVGCLGIGAGAAAAFLFRAMPPSALAYWLLPLTVVIAAGWLIARVWGRGVAVVATVAALAGGWVLVTYFWTGHLPTVDSPGAAPTTHSAGAGVAGDRSEGLQEVALAVPQALREGVFRQQRRLNVPAGFSVSVFAAGFEAPRFLASGPGGELYVSDPPTGKVYALPDRDGDGVADSKIVFADGMNGPHGLAFAGQDLYVAAIGRLLRLRDSDGDMKADVKETFSKAVPGAGGHWTRTVVVGPDRKLYLSAGSSCNVCIEEDPGRAAVLRYNPNGEREIFARGLRNSVGLAFHPETGDLWGSENGRDWLGDNLPPEEINRIVEGGDYGWPFCYGQRLPDPEYGSAERCADTLVPAVEMQAHSAPLGIAFGFDAELPRPYRSMLFVAFHGSWNRSVPTGYKLVGIPFRDGRPAGAPVDVVTGWLRDSSVWGRPVDPLVGADGALYLTDDRAGAIYRISADGNE